MGLEIKNMHVSVDGKHIIKGIDLAIRQGEIHVLMGPNGSGKSTLAMAVMGHPKYKISEGSVVLNGEDITSKPVDERSKKGMFLSFQHPVEIPGVGMMNFMRMISSSGTKMCDFRSDVKEKMQTLRMDESFTKRYLNEGFSGGEKKRSEMLQMSMLKPEIAILDEIDSGLDVDALKAVAETIKTMGDSGVLLITHYSRMLDYIKPNYVHILVGGRIVKFGGSELVKEIEKNGYNGFG